MMFAVPKRSKRDAALVHGESLTPTGTIIIWREAALNAKLLSFSASED